MKHVEMIIDYVTDGTDFQYSDNRGILVRCKDCKYYDPPHINDNGKRIEYSDLRTDLPQEVFCIAEHIVSAKYGVNVGGRCTVDYHNGYSEDKRVYRKETDFCSKGEREVNKD